MKAPHITSSHGYSSLIAVFLLFVMSFTGTTLIDMTSADVRIKSQELETTQALQVGNGGIQFALKMLKSGKNPNAVSRQLGQGEFTISTAPTQRQVSVWSRVGEAEKTQLIETPFSNNCVEVDTSHGFVDGNAIKDIRIRKACHDAINITALDLKWVGDPLEPIDKITVNTNPVYGPGGTGNNGEILDILQLSLMDNGWYQIEYHFSEPIVSPTHFTLDIHFEDDSYHSTTFDIIP